MPRLEKGVPHEVRGGKRPVKKVILAVHEVVNGLHHSVLHPADYGRKGGLGKARHGGREPPLCLHLCMGEVREGLGHFPLFSGGSR